MYQLSAILNVASSEAVIAIAFDTVAGQPVPQFVHAYTFCQLAGFLKSIPIQLFDTGTLQFAVRPAKGPAIAFVNALTVNCDEL